jgi:hypothetical protein
MGPGNIYAPAAGRSPGAGRHLCRAPPSSSPAEGSSTWYSINQQNLPNMLTEPG